MILMNARTENLFSDNAKYPLLTNGTWFNRNYLILQTPGFIYNPACKTKSLCNSSVDTSYATPLDSWRQPGNPESSNFIYADWPIPIDLSYTDTDLKTAGLGGFPIGDLNWFPTEYARGKLRQMSNMHILQYGL